jgi:DUF4097 and DUF4098 domain-containing protein YvlB
MLNKILKISFIVVIVGIVMATVGVVVVGQNFEEIMDWYNRDEEYAAVEQATDELFTKITIEAVNRKVIISPTAESEIKINYYESDKDFFIYTEKDGEISLKNKVLSPYVWIFPTWVSPEINTITIELPDTFVGELKLISTNGNIEIRNISSLEQVSMTTTNGSVVVKNINIIANIFAASTNGLITFEDNVIEGNLYASTTNGTITLKNNDCDAISVSTSNGNVNITHPGLKDDYKIDVRTTNGKITLDGLKISSQVLNINKTSSIKARTTNGSISIDFTN